MRTPNIRLLNIDGEPVNPNWEPILRVLFTDHCKVGHAGDSWHVKNGDQLFVHVFECLMGFMKNVFPTEGDIYQLDIDKVSELRYSHPLYSGPCVSITQEKDGVVEVLCWDFPSFLTQFFSAK